MKLSTTITGARSAPTWVTVTCRRGCGWIGVFIAAACVFQAAPARRRVYADSWLSRLCSPSITLPVEVADWLSEAASRSATRLGWLLCWVIEPVADELLVEVAVRPVVKSLNKLDWPPF